MKSITLKYLSLTLCVVLCLVFVFAMTFTKPVYAAEADNEIVLDELTSDPDFNPEDYPDNPEDFSLKVIQIGEDEDKNLYLYVYQPSHNSIDLLGTSVSISYGFSSNGSNLSPQMYELEFVSTSGVFDKYLVKDFAEATGSNAQGQRYYNIVAIYREFNSVIDSSIDYGETDEIGYSVGQQWYAYDVNNSVSYQMNTFETLEVTINLPDYIYVEDGFNLGQFLLGGDGACYVWYAAFDLEDYVATHIYDADISFEVRSVETTTSYFIPSTTYGEWQPKSLTLTDYDMMTHKGEGIFDSEISWNRILTASDFISTLENNKASISDEAKTKLQNSQWVFTFYETDYVSVNVSTSKTELYSEVGSIAILRLHFMDINQDVYDLGVVTDKVSADNVPGASIIPDFSEQFAQFWEMFKKVILLILVVVLVVVLLNFITPVISVLSFILKAIGFTISLPFKLLKSLFKKDG